MTWNTEAGLTLRPYKRDKMLKICYNASNPMHTLPLSKTTETLKISKHIHPRQSTTKGFNA